MSFKRHLLKYLSEDEVVALLDSLNKPWTNGLLLNTEKMPLAEFCKHFPNLEKHPVVPNAFLFKNEDFRFGKHIFHDLGAYYIQEPSAMLVAHFLNPTADDVVLDLCAAPGGKSIGASLLMKNQGLIYSNDIAYDRALSICQNMERLGRANMIVTFIEIRRKHTHLFNRFSKIIVDAPCSGSAMFRKDPKMKEDWCYQKVQNYAKTQKRLLQLAFEVLKPGGELIYSTCSFSHEENEEVVLNLLANNEDASMIDLPHIPFEYRPKDLKEAIRIFPHLGPGEGHFIAKIKKAGILDKKVGEVPEKKSTYLPKVRYDFNLDPLVLSFPKRDIISGISLNLKPIPFIVTIRHGVKIAEIRNGIIFYDHALSHYLPADNSYPLCEEELEKYLRGECLNLDLPDGYQLVSYLGMNVGFGKVSKGILKNHYPKGLRKK